MRRHTSVTLHRPFLASPRWAVAAVALLLPWGACATEETAADPALTVRRAAPAFPAADPLTTGALSVVRATSATEEILNDLQPEAAGLTAIEEETETVPFSALPEAVRASAVRRLGGPGDYRAARYSDQDAEMYQVSAIKDGLAIELVLTEEGELAFETREIPFSRLPAAVQAALRRRHPEGKFTTVQSVTAHAYSAVYRDEQGAETEIRIEPSGIIESDQGEASAPTVGPDSAE